ncbi:MAG: hypothetical protein AAGB12_15430, partial [Pseudomonadota bacterium]
MWSGLLVRFGSEYKGADINTIDTDGWSPLHHASDLGLEWFITRLKELGANTKIISLKGHTA